MKIILKLKEYNITNEPPFKVLKKVGIADPYYIGLIHGHILKGEVLYSIRIIKDLTGFGLVECKRIQDEFIRELEKWEDSRRI